MRNLMALYGALPGTSAQFTQYKAFTDTNANSIWPNDQETGYEFGARWQAPLDSADAARQNSALDALVAAAAMQGSGFLCRAGE